MKALSKENMAAIRDAGMATLNKGADIAFKTAVVVLTLRFMGILQ